MNFKLKLNYYTNFSPCINKQKTFLKKKMLLRSFFVLFYVLKGSNDFKKISVFIKPIQNNDLVLLRAPYRYKLAKLQITVRRHNIQINIEKKNSTNLTYSNIIKYKPELKKFAERFESVLFHTHKYTYYFDITCKQNFILNNFILIFVNNFFQKIRKLKKTKI